MYETCKSLYKAVVKPSFTSNIKKSACRCANLKFVKYENATVF